MGTLVCYQRSYPRIACNVFIFLRLIVQAPTLPDGLLSHWLLPNYASVASFKFRMPSVLQHHFQSQCFHMVLVNTMIKNC